MRMTIVTLIGLVLVALSVLAWGDISVIKEGEQTTLPAERSNMLPAPTPESGMKHAAVWYGRGGATVQRASNGDLYCMGNIQGPILLHSSDGGVNWTSTVVDIEAWGSVIAFSILKDDSMLLVFEPPGDSHRVVYTGRSTDYGKSWRTQRMRLDLGAFTHVSGKDGNVVELPDGTLLVGLQLWGGLGSEGPIVSEGQAQAFVFQSTDGGQTWSRSGQIATSVRHTRLVRLASGKLLACVYKPEASNLFVVESADDGRTWSNERELAVEGPGLGDLTVLKDGTVVLAYLYKYDPAHELRTEGVRAIVSYDEGMTWQQDVYVLGHWGTGGYGGYLPGSIALADGKLLSACVTSAGGGLRFHAVTWQPAVQK